MSLPYSRSSSGSQIMSLYESENHSRSSSNGPTPIKMNIGGTPRTEKAGLIEGKMTPLTPTANLKILMSAVSPALREKERQEKEGTLGCGALCEIQCKCSAIEYLWFYHIHRYVRMYVHVR